MIGYPACTLVGVPTIRSKGGATAVVPADTSLYLDWNHTIKYILGESGGLLLQNMIVNS